MRFVFCVACACSHCVETVIIVIILLSILLANTAKMGLVETKLAIIPGAGNIVFRLCLCILFQFVCFLPTNTLGECDLLIT